jgi:uncharacterized protein YndB with AHSA1/START domain/DNA-binding transcriptional ArsR family regulator
LKCDRLVTYNHHMETVFRALADDSRREVLDLLFEHDGRNLGELAEHFEMTRFGVMKHLRVLEEAGLVATKRVGREKLHYLNPVPIRQIHDRWTSKFAGRAAATLIDLKKTLEEETMDLMHKPTHVFEIFIQTTPEHLWEALTESDFTTQYYYASKIESDFNPGSDFTMTLPDGTEAIRGEVVEAEPAKRLVTTFDARWDDGVAADEPSRISWDIEQQGEAVKLKVTHNGFAAETETYRQIAGGMPYILSGLKTLLETGKPLAVART